MGVASLIIKKKKRKKKKKKIIFRSLLCALGVPKQRTIIMIQT